ncbi:MAG TPA: HAD-IA family hydrolase, partial [Candidatus Dormibacteraeota bacterium]|nr:HAD-IA family hydrolase [Candidatus Dormibacteraeota bacterium]
AWKQVFDQHGIPFDEVKDYDAYVDGKPREEGVRALMEAKGLSPDPTTVTQIAEQKDRLFLDLIHREGVQTYPGSTRYLDAARAQGKTLAVVSSSRHTTEVLKAAGLQHAFAAQVDGIVAEREHLPGKPAPDTYLRAAEMLDAKPENAAVYEDALAGVESGRAGQFGLVVGVDRAGQREELEKHGADVVVDDLADLLDG